MGQREKRPVKPLWYVNFTKSFLDQLKRLKLIGNWLLISCYIILLASINWHLSPRSTLAQWVYLRPSTNFQIKPQHRQTHFLFPLACQVEGLTYTHCANSQVTCKLIQPPLLVSCQRRCRYLSCKTFLAERSKERRGYICRFTPKDIPLHLIII